MEKKLDVKKYVGDRLACLAINLGITIILLKISPLESYYLMPIYWVISLAYWGRDWLVIIDYFQGRIEKIAYFQTDISCRHYDVDAEKYFSRWLFYSENEDLLLIASVNLKEEELNDMETPLDNQKVKIKYYKLSRILSSWEPVED